MKTQKKNGRPLNLKTRNNRWKWMAGATAATAAGVTASQASTITVNLLNNYISVANGNHLNVDLTGDGHPDLTVVGAAYYTNHISTTRNRASVAVTLNGIHAKGYFTGNPSGTEILGSRTGRFNSELSGTQYLMGSIPIFFKDLHINGGAPTRGSLEVTVFPTEIQLDSFTYNTPGQNTPNQSFTTPDQGSSLALLAMGAGGILALRRWRAAQGRS